MNQSYRIKLLLLPLYLVSTFIVILYPQEIQIVSNGYYFQFIASLFLSLVLSILLLAKSIVSITINLIDIFVIFFFLYVSFRLIHTSGENILEYSYLINILIVVVFFYAKFYYSNLNWNLKYLLYPILLCIGFVEIFIGLLQFSGLLKNLYQGYRIGGTLGNPGPFANFLACFMIISVSELLFPISASRLYKLFVIICMVLFLTGILLSSSRTSWIAVSVGSAFLLYNKYGISGFITSYLFSFHRKIIAVVLILVIAVGVGYFLYNFKKDSALGRILIWKNTVELIMDKPAIGVGYERFNTEVHEYQANYFKNNPNSKYKMLADDVQFAFNDYLQITANYGFIGLLLFLGIFLTPFYINLNKKAENPVFLKSVFLSRAILITVLITAMFSYPLEILPVCIILFYFAGILSGLYQNGFKIPILNIFSKSIISVLLCFFLIASFFSFKQLAAAKRWHKTKMEFDSVHLYEGLREYEKLSEIFYGNEAFYYDYSGKLMDAHMYEKAIYMLEKAGNKINTYDFNLRLGTCNSNINNHKKAEYYFTKASQIVPSKLYPKYLLIELYKKVGNKELLKLRCNEFLDTKSKFYTQQEGNLKIKVIKILEEINSN